MLTEVMDILVQEAFHAQQLLMETMEGPCTVQEAEAPPHRIPLQASFGLPP
jgi:hypothetical protein